MIVALCLSMLAQPWAPDAPGPPLQQPYAQYVKPPAPPVQCTTLSDFDTSIAGNGFMISECEFMRIIRLRSEALRMTRELIIVNELRDKEFDIWKLSDAQYRATIVRLEGEVAGAQDRGWWERHAMALGVAAGVLGTFAISYTAVQIQ